MNFKEKYIFKPSNPIFPGLFEKEKERIEKSLGNIRIEHVGSTAVAGLGGKGIIDILIVAPKEEWETVSGKLKALGYEYKKKDEVRENQRLFFMANLPDKELGTRLYHIHLAYPGGIEQKRMIGFRDFLRSHPKEAEEYSEIKKKASEESQKFSTKNEMRDAYSQTKEEFIEKFLAEIKNDPKTVF